jgi:hypothetical protein
MRPVNRLAVILVAAATLSIVWLVGHGLSDQRSPSRPESTWNVAVHDGDDYLVWQTGFASRLSCFQHAAALNEQYQNVVFTCAEVFNRPLPFSPTGHSEGPRSSSARP